MKQRFLLIALLLFSACAWAQTPSEPLYISGLNPDKRPAQAPATTGFTPVGMSNTALKGVEGEPAASLQFLNNQGAWFTPFTRPGMTGPYDIRGWHTNR